MTQFRASSASSGGGAVAAAASRDAPGGGGATANGVMSASPPTTTIGLANGQDKDDYSFLSEFLDFGTTSGLAAHIDHVKEADDGIAANDVDRGGGGERRKANGGAAGKGGVDSYSDSSDTDDADDPTVDNVDLGLLSEFNDILEGLPELPPVNFPGTDVAANLSHPLKKVKEALEQKHCVILKEFSFWLQDEQLPDSKILGEECIDGFDNVVAKVICDITEDKTFGKRIKILDVIQAADAADDVSPSSSPPSTPSSMSGEAAGGGRDARRNAAAWARAKRESRPFGDAVAAVKFEGHADDGYAAAAASTSAAAQNWPPDARGPKGRLNGGRMPMSAASHAADATSMSGGGGGGYHSPNPSFHFQLSDEFAALQARGLVPRGIADWTQEHTQMWAQWSKREFPGASIHVDDWLLPGNVLLQMTQASFLQRVSIDERHLFWAHVQLLKSGVVAVPQTMAAADRAAASAAAAALVKPKKRIIVGKYQEGQILVDSVEGGLRTGKNGQGVQLWRFLLDILTDVQHCDIIEWDTSQGSLPGEFRMNNPEAVAQLWGSRKARSTMSYEKMSRALRYYKGGNILDKVRGKRFTYRFICSLRDIVGFDSQELADKVKQQAHEQHRMKVKAERR